MSKRSAPVIMKKEQISQVEGEVLIRLRSETPGGPSVMLRTDPDGRSVLDVTCTCGRRFDLVLDEEEA